MREEDFRLNNDTDRQKYLNDLERLRRIKENERYNNKNKSVSEYIEDYYYDVDDSPSHFKADDGYGEYEEFLKERNQSVRSNKSRSDDLSMFEFERSRVRKSLPDYSKQGERHFSKEEDRKRRSKREEYLETRNSADSPLKRNFSVQTGLRMPELNGDLEKRRLAIQQAQREAMRKRELEEAAILEQRRRDEELEQERRLQSSNRQGTGNRLGKRPERRKTVGTEVIDRQNVADINGVSDATNRLNPSGHQKLARHSKPSDVSGNTMLKSKAASSSEGLHLKNTSVSGGRSMAKRNTRSTSRQTNPNVKKNSLNAAMSHSGFLPMQETVEHPLHNKSGKKNSSNFGGSSSSTSKKEKEKVVVPFGKRVKRFIGNIFKVILVSLLFFSGFLLYSFYTKQEGYYTVAIFGVDSRNGNVGKDALADVNMIANINRETGAIQLVSVYRDMITEIDGKGTYHKLNEAYFKGGASKAVAALERNLDLDIEGYATFNWKAVVDGINILGGIDLEITEPEFKYINSFITETVEGTGVGSHHLEHAGMNHLDGVQAVAYARLRLMDTDFNRTERQRKVVKLALDKAKKADFATINNIVVTILPQIATNMTVDDLIPFAKDVKKYYLAESTGFPFELVTMNIGKRDYVVPVTLKSNVVKLHSFLYGDMGTVNYSPSIKLKEISKYIISVSGHGEDKDDIEIKIDKGGEGGIGPKGGGSKSKSDETTKPNASTEASTEAESTVPEETTKEEETTKSSEEETIETIEPQTLAPETPPPSPQEPEDQGDAGVPDSGGGNSHGPGGDALSDDAENGPGVVNP